MIYCSLKYCRLTDGAMPLRRRNGESFNEKKSFEIHIGFYLPDNAFILTAYSRKRCGVV